MRGILVVLEGIDGAGKSTLAGRLAEVLRARGHTVLQTREPTDGPFGKKIRALAQSGRDVVRPEDELFLFHEDRRAHVETVVRPALARGEIVIQDRSYFSTIAYQGERGLERARIREESERIAPRPDLLLVVDLPVAEALRRIAAGRSGGADDFEKAESLERIRKVFLAFPDAIVLDGGLSPSALAEAALAAFDDRCLS